MSKDVKFLIEQILVDVKEGYLTERARWKSFEGEDKRGRDKRSIDIYRRTPDPYYLNDNEEYVRTGKRTAWI